VQALVVTPGEAGSTRVADVPARPAPEGTVLVRPLEVGVCGTDREICEGIFGVAPGDDPTLVLGHELLGVVERDGDGFLRGDLVTATVRRSCRRCLACEQGSPDSCLTGLYEERGITRLHGFARELVAEDPGQLVAVPASLGRLGVLAEPASICARALRHARLIGGRHPWEPSRALVIGGGAIGMLTTYLLRLQGTDVWTASLDGPASPRARLVEASGARYVASGETPLSELRDDVGGFDLVVEAAGDAQVMAETLGLLRRSGVACLVGIDPRDRAVQLPGPTIGLDAILENRVLFGSVNAHPQDWLTAVDALDAARRRWPEALERFVGLRVGLDGYEEAFAYAGVKATLVLDDMLDR
jgi:threonine dehydrogenase-like Zn-dependent dehydrogenase